VAQESWDNAQRVTHAETCHGAAQQGERKSFERKISVYRLMYYYLNFHVSSISMRRLGNTKRLQVIISHKTGCRQGASITGLSGIINTRDDQSNEQN